MAFNPIFLSLKNSLIHTLCLCAIILLPAVVYPQQDACFPNLVPNPSFEDYEECPDHHVKLQNYIPWKNPSNGEDYGAQKGSPDAFNACSTDPRMDNSVPKNYNGFQEAVTGTSYAGLLLYSEPHDNLANFREYIQVKLLQPLTAGNYYQVSFHASLADNSIYATDDLGAYISREPVIQEKAQPLSHLTPQITNPEGKILIDKSAWRKISAIYLATGGEEYLTIGNFKDDENTTLEQVPSRIFQKSAYVYIDDVAVSEVPPVFEITAPTTLCEGAAVQLSAHAAGVLSYHWHPAAGLDNANSATPIASPAATTTYTVTGTLANGCILSEQVAVMVETVAFAVTPSAIQGYTPLTVQFDNQSIGAEDYRWHVSNGETIAADSLVYTFTQAGLHTIELEATTPSSCTYRQAYQVEVKDFFIPNVITPDGSKGKNDFFALDLFDTWELHIYNRWGKKVFYRQHYANEFTAQGLPSGVYYYTLRNEKSNQSLNGWVAVVREE